MRLKDVGGLALGISFLLVLYLFIDERERNKRLEGIAAKAIGERDYYKKQYLNLLESKLIANDAPIEVLKELEKLKTYYEGIDVEVHQQITTVINLLRDGYKEKAVFDLSKLIENILKVSYEKTEEKKCKMKFYKLLEYAEEMKWITQVEHSFATYMKKIRNKEGHSLNVEIEEREACLALYSGIELIYKLPKK